MREVGHVAVLDLLRRRLRQLLLLDVEHLVDDRVPEEEAGDEANEEDSEVASEPDEGHGISFQLGCHYTPRNSCEIKTEYHVGIQS